MAWADVLENCRMDTCGGAGPSNGSAACLHTLVGKKKKTPFYTLDIKWRNYLFMNENYLCVRNRDLCVWRLYICTYVTMHGTMCSYSRTSNWNQSEFNLELSYLRTVDESYLYLMGLAKYLTNILENRAA